jgi:hypothetical protein
MHTNSDVIVRSIIYSLMIVIEHSNCSKILRAHICAKWRISDLILRTKKHTIIIPSQQNGRDIPAERYADIIKPTAKLLTFIWEMWRFRWHFVNFITVHEMPGRRFPLTSLQGRAARAPGSHLLGWSSWNLNMQHHTVTQNMIAVVPTSDMAAGKTVGITN